MADAFLGGRLRLRQPDRGHRCGTDAVLLAACAPPQAAGLALDVGAGVGVVGLCVLTHAPALRAELVEIDPAAAALARENILANGLSERARAVTADVLTASGRRAAGLGVDFADFIFTNPPFYEPGAVRATPDPDKARAHIAQAAQAAHIAQAGQAASGPSPEPGGVEAWMKACVAMLAPGGWFFMIHRPEALPAILAAARGRLGELRLKPVLARPDRPAIRLLLAGRKGARGPLRILPELALFDAGGARSAQEKAIAMGQGRIDMEAAPLKGPLLRPPP